MEHFIGLAGMINYCIEHDLYSVLFVLRSHMNRTNIVIEK